MSPSSRKILSYACLLGCTVCLAVGQVMTAQWLALIITLVCGAGWWVAVYKRLAAGWFSVMLVVLVGLAAVGLLAGNPPVLMIFSAALALASWDLALFDRTVTDLASTSAETLTLFENSHYQNLALALGLGLSLAIGGRLLRFEIPLSGLIVLVFLALFGLDRVWRALRH